MILIQIFGIFETLQQFCVIFLKSIGLLMDRGPDRGLWTHGPWTAGHGLCTVDWTVDRTWDYGPWTVDQMISI